MSTLKENSNVNTVTIDGAYLKGQAKQAVRTFFAPLRWPAKAYKGLHSSVSSLIDSQLEQRRIATMVVNKVKFVGSKSIEDLPNDKWFVQKSIKEYKTNPKFKAGADAVMKPVKTAGILTGLILAGVTVAAFTGIPALIGTVALAVGTFTLAPGLKQDFDQASKDFKEKVMPPFMLKTGLSVFRYSSKEKAHDVADGVKTSASKARQKISGLFKKKSDKKDETPKSDKAPTQTPKGPKPPAK